VVNAINNVDSAERTKHDQLFKELIEAFFEEFIELFFPEIHKAIDFSQLNFLKQEQFIDIVEGESKVVDLLVETKLKGEDSVIVVHIDNQAQYQENFSERMFWYFIRIYHKLRYPIIPIAVFSYDEVRDEPANYKMEFPFLKVVDFNYLIVQLKKKNWKEYIESDNPIAGSLMSKMDYGKDEKIRVKLEFLKIILRLQLNLAQVEYLVKFFDTYLVLTPQEESELEKAMKKELPEKEVSQMAEIMTSWERRGLEKGKAEVVIRILSKKFGELPEDLTEKINSAHESQIESLIEDILQIQSLDDVCRYLK